MNEPEKKLIDILSDLKENYHAISVKAEFETECGGFEDALRLKNAAFHAGLEMAVKIGGCESIKDLYDARTIGVQTIVAPMIESPYAAKKYINAVRNIFSETERKSMNILINIETKYGFEYIEEILKSDYAGDLTGIVFGRSDMAGSLNLNCASVNSDLLLDYAQKLAGYAEEYKKDLVIGGAVSTASVPFFKKIPQTSFKRFETRKIIFDAQKVLNDKNINAGIEKAIEFELLWIKNKQSYSILSPEDIKRIKILQSRV